MEDDQPEQLRSADDGAGEGAALDIGQDLLGSADLQAGGGGSDHDMGDDDYQDDEVVEVVEEDTALGSLATPGAPAAGGTPGQGDTPGLPGADTPGIELGVVDDSPEATPEAAPELGVGGVVVEEAPWAGGEGEAHAGAARQRSARATEVGSKAPGGVRPPSERVREEPGGGVGMVGGALQSLGKPRASGCDKPTHPSTQNIHRA